jgi:hypothetical protein
MTTPRKMPPASYPAHAHAHIIPRRNKLNKPRKESLSVHHNNTATRIRTTAHQKISISEILHVYVGCCHVSIKNLEKRERMSCIYVPEPIPRLLTLEI